MKSDISRLLKRYLANHEGGHDAYFDADEIDDLLDSFEESDDYTYYDEVLALGLRLHPGNSDLQIRRCKLYTFHEEYDSALTLIDTIADTDNQDLDMLRLECYCMLDQYDQAVRYTEKLIAADCEYLEDLFEYIAPILSDADMAEEAYDYIKRGLALFPQNLILKDELCYYLETEGEIEKAIEVCNELIDENPYSYDYWFTLGRLHSVNADYEKAIEAFDFALACDDSDEELKILKAYCFYMNENYLKAIEQYNELAVDEESRLRVTPLLAECYIKLDDYEQAYTLLKELVESKDPTEDATIYLNYIRCCAETERGVEASRMLAIAAEKFPRNVRVLSLLALTYMDNEDEMGARETTDRLFNALDQMDEAYPEDIESIYRAGQYLYLKGDVDRALKYYQKVFEADPDTPFLHLHMCLAYMSKGDMKNFGKHFSHLTPEEVLRYLKNAGVKVDDLMKHLGESAIPPENLVSEFLKNKDNKN